MLTNDGELAQLLSHPSSNVKKIYHIVLDRPLQEIDFEKIIIGEQGFILEPGMFVLGQTAEQLSVSQKLACMLDARTTLARIGLNVLQGSTFIQPGQSQSHETLEINNISKNPIRIYAGMKIVKGIFFLLQENNH